MGRRIVSEFLSVNISTVTICITHIESSWPEWCISTISSVNGSAHKIKLK